MVTGASSGVGLMTALGLAQQGGHVFIACRSEAKAAAAIAFIRGATQQGTIEYLPLDLACLDSVRRCAERFKQRRLPLHLLVNNAGIFFGDGLTPAGVNRIIGVNYLGHFLLTQLLLEPLSAGAARIVLVASDAAYQVESVDWSLFFSSGASYPIYRRVNHTLRAYALSKLCLLLMMAKLGQMGLGQMGLGQISVNAVHPGFVQSNISALHRCSRWLGIGVSPAEGAESALFCATAPELTGVSGKFLGPDCAELALPAIARDAELAQELWQRSLSLAGLEETDQGSPPLRYDGTDGLWGPFKLQASSANAAAITEAISQATSRAPLQPLLRSLLQSWVTFQGVMPTFFNLFQLFTGRYYMDRHLDSELVRALCTDPGLRRALRPFLGDRFLLWRSEIWVSKPGGKVVPFWHQDRYANYLKGSESITAYIALTEVNGLNGMQYMPQRYVESGEVRVADRELAVIRVAGNRHFTMPKALEAKAVPVCLQPGEFVLFDDRFVHSSIQNRGKGDRVSMAVRFVQADAEVRSGFSALQAEPIALTAQ